MTPRFPRRGTPGTFGCVRDRSLDCCGWLCWERPDGSRVWLHHTVGMLVQVSADVRPVPEIVAVQP